MGRTRIDRTQRPRAGSTGPLCALYSAPLTLLRGAHEDLLDPVEHERRAGFRQPGDRERFVLATALLRLAVAAWSGEPPARVEVDRTCERCQEPHGRPRLPGTGLHASISHASDYVAVAVCDIAAVGVDIEQTGRVAFEPLLDLVCTASERRHVTGDADFCAFWTRKESVLKATGIGLSLPMTEVVVTPPTEHPRVLAYAGRQGFAARMFERPFDARYGCVVTVLTDSPVELRVGDAERLLVGTPGIS
jgi:4'-phosphopantetheinyl transferase